MTRLGRFDASVLVFGGPYGNLEATWALFAEAARRGVALSPLRLLWAGAVPVG